MFLAAAQLSAAGLCCSVSVSPTAPANKFHVNYFSDRLLLLLRICQEMRAGCWAELGWAGLGWAGLGWAGWPLDLRSHCHFAKCR